MDWQSVLGNVAPILASAAGGPVAIAATAVQILSKKLLGRSDGTAEEVQQMIASGNPDVLLKIKEAELEAKKVFKEAEVKIEEINAADRASARQLAIATGTRPQVILTLLFVGGYFVIMVMVLSGFIRVPPEWKDLAMTLIGIITTNMVVIMTYWFGSTKSSSDKNAMIAEKMGS